MSHSRFLELLQQLDPEKIEIKHNPMTERYRTHAFSSLVYLLKNGVCIGWRKLEKPILDEMIEVVIWAEPLFADSCGFYSCFRLHFLQQKLERATFFCFYDGKDKSPCFKSQEDATRSMNSWADKNNTKYHGATL